MRGFFGPNDGRRGGQDREDGGTRSDNGSERRHKTERRKRSRRASDLERDACLPEPVLSEAEIAALLRGGR